MKNIITLASVGALSACSFAMLLTPENSTSTTFPSSLSSEQVFRNVLRSMRDCYPSGFTIEQTYFPEAKEGELVLASVDSTYRAEAVKILTKSTVGGSEAALIKRKNASKEWDRAVENWMTGTVELCPNGTRSDPRPPGSVLSPQNNPVR